jgi:hypothetical protein
MPDSLEPTMLCKLAETFTATHLVAVIGIVALAPGALYAAGALTNVVITGADRETARVDEAHRLWTYDPIAGYTKNLFYAMNITDTTTSAAGLHSIYTVPAGKVLVIKSVSWSDFGNTEGNNSFYYLYSAALTGLYNTEGLHIANTTTRRSSPGSLSVPAH